MEEKNVHRLPWIKNPFRLWSLVDVLKIAAEKYVRIGQVSARIQRILLDMGKAEEPLKQAEKNLLTRHLTDLKDVCNELQLRTPSIMLTKAINDLSAQHLMNAIAVHERITTLIELMMEDMKIQLFLFVPPHKAAYYDLSNDADLIIEPENSFPQASMELVHAGNCFATDECTASVFHAMRAAEIGLRTLAHYLKVQPPKGITYAQWGELIIEIEKTVNQMRSGKKTKAIETKITFCSDALAHFRNLKDAYRNHVSHARRSYVELEAQSIMDGTRTFLQSLATKLSEPKTK